MNFLDAVRAALDGTPIRCKGWTKGVMLRWNWNSLKWEAAYYDQNKAIEPWMPTSPSPIEMLKDDWEVVDQVTHLETK